MPKPLITIVIISFDNWSFTKTCLTSIIQNTKYPNYEIIIVDNASDKPTIKSLKKFAENLDTVNVIYNQKNLGFAKANNLGAKHAKGSYLVFLNNDTIVSEGWLEKLVDHITNTPDAGMFGPVTNAIGNEAKVSVDYSEPTLEAINQFAKKRSKCFSGQFFEIKVLALFCSIIAKELFDQVGGLDERYGIGTFEDDDLALKVNQQGLKLYCAEDTFVHHFHGASFKKLSKFRQMVIFQINKYKYERKWNVKWSVHQNRKDNH